MRFVTIMEGAKNVHLMKGVGQIAYQMQKRFGYEARLACFNNDTYTYMHKEVRGLHMDFLPRVCGFKVRYLGVLLYLLRNRTKIDVLHLTHLKKRTIIYGHLYLLLNPHGILFYKYDCPYPHITFRATNLAFPLKHSVMKLGSRILEKCAFVSVETNECFHHLDLVPMHKRIMVPNAVDEDWIATYGLQCKSFAAKKEIIILVGKHGTAAKNSELMLDALTSLELHTWQVIFVGTCTESFTQKSEALLKARPSLRNHIQFTGHVYDKKKLFSLYNDAKIICLPSRSEGFPNVIVEAIYFGAVPVMTQHLPASHDLTMQGKAGMMFPNENSVQLSACIHALISHPDRLQQLSENSKKLSRQQYLWRHCARRIHNKIQQNRHSVSFSAERRGPNDAAE